MLLSSIINHHSLLKFVVTHFLILAISLSIGATIPILAQEQNAQTKDKIKEQLIGNWVLISWKERYGGDLHDGELTISEDLVGMLTGISGFNKNQIIEKFSISITENGIILMRGELIEGDNYYADNFSMRLNPEGTKLYGRSIDTSGDIIDAVFVKPDSAIL